MGMEFMSEIFLVTNVFPGVAFNTTEVLGLALWGGALVGLSAALRARLAPRVVAAPAIR